MTIAAEIPGTEYRVTQIAIFASGAGSNAHNIIEHFATRKHIARVALIVCNKPGAGVLNIAKKNGIPTLLLEKELFTNGNAYVSELEKRGISFITLAGFLWKVPQLLIKAYPGRIINIHPALLPKFGGSGMYGNRVHEAVINAGDKESGITIHYVDELYDHGKIILQATCPVNSTDTVTSVAQKIHALEYEYYPSVIEGILCQIRK